MTPEEFDRYRARVAAALQDCGCDNNWPNGLCRACVAIVDRFTSAQSEHLAALKDACEWNPTENRPAHQGENHAPVAFVVGKTRDNNYRLCAQCVELPRFKRFKRTPVKQQRLTVERAAIRCMGLVFSVPRPGRHGDVIRAMVDEFGEDEHQARFTRHQGFVLSDGSFAGRQAAWSVAKVAGQLMKRAPTDGNGGTLFSEDCW